MDKAASLGKKLIFAIETRPLLWCGLYELIENGKLDPELIIGVPVGFVNVVQSKELIMKADVPTLWQKDEREAVYCRLYRQRSALHDRQTGETDSQSSRLFNSLHAGRKSSEGMAEQERSRVTVPGFSSRISRRRPLARAFFFKICPSQPQATVRAREVPAEPICIWQLLSNTSLIAVRSCFIFTE